MRCVRYRGPDTFTERERYWLYYQPDTAAETGPQRLGEAEHQWDERAVAEHEAAHAIASLVTGNTVGEIRLGSDLDDTAAGEFRARVDPHSPPLDPDDEDAAYSDLCDTLSTADVAWALDRLTTTLAPFAYELGAGRDSARKSCSTDVERARTMAAAVTADGLAKDRLLDRALLRAAGIVDERREQIRALGAELFRRRRMIGTEVESFLATRGFSTVLRVDMPGPAIAAVYRLRGGDRGSIPSRPRSGVRIVLDEGDSPIGEVRINDDGEFEAWTASGQIGVFADLGAAARAI
jgi:hypothetical protein